MNEELIEDAQCVAKLLSDVGYIEDPVEDFALGMIGRQFNEECGAELALLAKYTFLNLSD